MLSKAVYFLSVLIMFYATFVFYPRWKKTGTESAISWDVSGYYGYLPSVFIYKDLKHQSFKDSIAKKYALQNTEFQQSMQIENNNLVMKYAAGMAIMYLPFFAVAHWLASPLGYPADGFSLPYQLAIQMGGFLVSILGLWYFRKLLLQFYSDRTTAVVLALLVWGSNYLNYATIDNAMSHCWLFTIYVFILLSTVYFYQSFRMRYALCIGVLVGLATLIRPSDALSCLIPLLWGMESLSFAAIKKQALLIARNIKPFIAACLLAAAITGIQLVYWKYASGHWFFYSYNSQKLYFKSPNFLNYTFSYQSGWLTYSPMLFLAFAGILPYLRTGKNKVAIIVFFLLNYYVICSWNIWWYGGRAMVQSYPVLFFPVAALVDAAFTRKKWLYVLVPVALLFLYINIWVICFYHRQDGLGDVTGAYYWRALGRWNIPKEVQLLKDKTELYEQQPHNLKLIYSNDFSTYTSDKYVPHDTGRGKFLKLSAYPQHSDHYNLPVSAAPGKWVRVQATFYCTNKEWSTWLMTQFVARALHKGILLKENVERPYRVISDGEVKDIHLDMKLPTGCDELDILFWNAESKLPVLIDGLKVWEFYE